jgi:hypothetical protein
VAILFSSFTTSTLSAIFTLSVFFIGHFSPGLKYFGERSKSLITKYFSLGLYYILPNLENFNLKDTAVYGVSVEGLKVMYIFFYFLTYLALILLISNWLFSKRDFK